MSDELQKQIDDIERIISKLEEAIAIYRKRAEKSCQFKAGDVVRCGRSSEIRIIVFDEDNDDLAAYDLQGNCCCRGRDKFRGNGYTRTSVLLDYFPLGE